MKKKIYLTAFALGSGSGRVTGSRPGGDVMGEALCEDGEGLASHLSSSVGFAQHDMGMSSDWKHEIYTAHCPDGFELEWINEEDLSQHEGWRAAFRLNQEKRAERESAQPDDAVDPVEGVATK